MLCWLLLVEDDGNTQWHSFYLAEDGLTVLEEPVFAPLPGSQYVFLSSPIFETAYMGNRGGGKQILDTEKIQTARGWTTVGDVRVGDQVVAPDGAYTEVLQIYPSEGGELYRVTFDDGAEVVADAEHLWAVRSGTAGKRDGWYVRTTKHLLAAKDTFYIPTSAAAPGEMWCGPDPYIAGLLLGDGTMRSRDPTVYTADVEIREYLKARGWRAYETKPKFWMLAHSTRACWEGLIGSHKGSDKRAPRVLLDADPAARLALLQGLMDSDGSVDHEGRCTFVSISMSLAQDVQELVRSLGGKAALHWKNKVSPKGGTDGYFNVVVMPCNKFNPFRLTRKAQRVKRMKGVHRKICSIVPMPSAPATCFKVAHPSRQFVVTRAHIVTHNCVDEGDVLTPRGWVDIRAMKAGDAVYTFDPDGEMMESIVESTHVEDYDGPMVRREDHGLYMSFTPAHKLAVTWPDGTNLLRPYSDISGQADVLRSIVRWEGAQPSEADVERAALIGWWLGCGRVVSGRPGLYPRTKIAANKLGVAMIGKTPNLRSVAHLKRVPRELLNAPPSVLRVLLNALIGGGGTWRTASTDAVLNTSNNGLADDLCEIGVKLSFNVSVKGWSLGAASKKRTSSVTLTPGKPTRIYTGLGAGATKNVTDDHFTGKVYCIEVPLSSSFVIRQRGCVWLSGNSDSLLLSFAAGVDRGWGKAYRGILFRKEFGDLDDIVRKVETIFPRIWGDRFRFLKSKSEYTATWDTGEALLLRNLPNEDAYREYHGHSYVWIGFEELTQWPDDKAYRLMFSCARSPTAGVPVVGIRSTSNPYGIGHNWVKKRFRLPQGFGKVIRRPGEAPRVAIQSDLRENFVLLHSNPNYPNLIRQAASNPAQAKAWLHGDWNVTTGGMFDDVWDAKVHIIPNVPPTQFPAGWKLNRTYDHGQSRPFACLWWAESNGEPIHFMDGRVVGQVAGDIVLFAEWYGTTGEPDEGIRMNARSIAVGIQDRQRDWRVSLRVRPGPADNEIYTKDQRGTNRSPADDMEDVGILWTTADKSPGSRSRGYQMIRSHMAAARPNVDGTREYPGLFVCERNVHWIELVPPAPRDPQDQDELPKKYEDHLVDCTRYRLSSEDTRPWQRGF